jgi:hypothetical protein
MITWLQAHWSDVVQIIIGTIGVASIIVKLTPTPKDDTILASIKNFISKFIALNP